MNGDEGKIKKGPGKWDFKDVFPRNYEDETVPEGDPNHTHPIGSPNPFHYIFGAGNEKDVYTPRKPRSAKSYTEAVRMGWTNDPPDFDPRTIGPKTERFLEPYGIPIKTSDRTYEEPAHTIAFHIGVGVESTRVLIRSEIKISGSRLIGILYKNLKGKRLSTLISGGYEHCADEAAEAVFTDLDFTLDEAERAFKLM